MKKYPVEQIRNIAVMGHLGSGKTSFLESVLQMTGAKQKKGSVEEKNTTSDYLTEEHNRLTSLSTSLIPVEYNGYKFNFLDTPGSEEFVNDVYQALSVVKGAVLVVDGTKGIDIGTERVLALLSEKHVPTVLFINKMDKQNIKFETLIDNIRNVIGYQAVPFLWPIGAADDFKGYVDLVDMKTRLYDGSKVVESDVSPEQQEIVEGHREKIVESVAETSEELLEKHFGGEDLTKEEIYEGLRQGVLAGDLKPIVMGTALKDIGIIAILDIIAKFMPSPNDLKPISGKNMDNGEDIVRNTNENEPFSGYVFKTTVDPFIGSVNLVKVFSGKLVSGKEVLVSNTKNQVKIGSIFTMRGKEQLEVEEIGAGDIGAVTKIESIFTGCTICDPKSPIIFDQPMIQTPTYFLAIHPKQKSDENKLSSVLQKLNYEDPTFEIIRNSETSQLLLGGHGTTHLGYLLDKMKNMFKVEVDTFDQKIVYRETIKNTAEAEGRHKKQSGGSGQFGVVLMRFEPMNPNEKEFEFVEKIHGGTVPKNYFPAVEKGLIETFAKGPLAGFPVIGVRGVLLDGAYHPVDSNEISFKLAASLAFKNALAKARPTILEPIMNVEIVVKDDYVGDVMGDVNKRRGRVLGMEPLIGGRQKISADIPEAEIVKYTIDLKAMTQGSGSFSRHFVRYDEVPESLIDKIIEEYKTDERR